MYLTSKAIYVLDQSRASPRLDREGVSCGKIDLKFALVARTVAISSLCRHEVHGGVTSLGCHFPCGS